jgi:hypothetical protein
MTIDKTDWGEGPWQHEDDRYEWIDEASDLDCLAIRHPESGHWCGYVAVPPGHPVHGKEYGSRDFPDLDVHGGITYTRACQGDVCHVPAPGRPDDVWWLGFDCAHAFDRRPAWEAFERTLAETDPSFASLLGRVRTIDEAIAADTEWMRPIYRTIDFVKSECARLAEQLREVGGADQEATTT